MTFLLIAAAIAVLLMVPWEVALVALGIALVIWQPWSLLVFGALALVGVLFAALGALGMKAAPLWAPVGKLWTRVSRPLARVPAVPFFIAWVGGWVLVYSIPVKGRVWPEEWPTEALLVVVVGYIYLPVLFLAARRSNKAESPPKG